MLAKDLLTNIPLPQEFSQKAAGLLREDERALFSIVGDLNLNGRYGSSA
jgi:hypothetical protein